MNRTGRETERERDRKRERERERHRPVSRLDYVELSRPGTGSKKLEGLNKDKTLVSNPAMSIS
jgi:hypothetical protein